MRRRFSPESTSRVRMLCRRSASLTRITRTDIAGHGHRHLLEVFRLGLGLGLEVHLSQLADSVDQFGDGLAELRL